MTVPLLDLKAQYADIKTEMDAAVHRVLDSARFIGGPEVSGLEEEVARYSQCAHAIGCASGTDALLLALRALDVGPGDEVVTGAYSFFASAGAVVNAGATPVFVDIDPASYNMDAHRLEAAITPRTKAVIAVHLYGQCSDLTAISAVCEKRNVWLIEDAAQAIGSEWEGRRAGSVGDLGCFSFFPSKNLGAAGDGGMVTAQDAALADRVRLLREHGARPKYYHALVGTNSRLDAVQAAILRVKLKHLDRWSEARARNAALYDQLFEGARVGRPYRDPRGRHIYNQYVIRVAGRDALRQHLGERGIGTEVYYPVPLHRQQCFATLGYGEGDMPQAEAAARETLALPIYPELTEEQIRYVAATVREFTDSH
ncbi:MAG: DegT/DnrJ/EryC1/StrS family aminotransferase [Candidatus Eisenbacteria bacterium]|uniref:DegT/DnrJ/EryC1/StrS family aminotransferase n=1 Tax=Eiseniibacteriota bacterium TaxID=2212470 RepID=A0A9D6QIY4_UNCEI|nr:DegT/DnrJ/EryC1/StrS family aminotransferase [Candidatus Eisenbacteria bacterium]MBI3539947.1 DegT/DnrJ/EryC1/StrS family aminotransferase [Candidatus Eisenbacteria bacterium]